MATSQQDLLDLEKKTHRTAGKIGGQTGKSRKRKS